MGGLFSKKKTDEARPATTGRPPAQAPTQQPIKPQKIVVLGDIEVGKTSLIVRFVDGTFEEGKVQNFDEPLSKDITVEGENMPFSITDTAGQERFRTLTSSYFRNAAAVIVIFDVTSRESFENVPGYLEEVNRYSTETCEQFLVGNKIDAVDKRAVGADAAMETAGMHNVTYFETSAKSGQGVEDLFVAIGKKLLPKAKAQAQTTITTLPSKRK